ncbi:hypothetical protein SAMN05892883_4183 [Jatrophihabitans sp. GAS493]|uniref:hypothetical protein n=1 Tax=Jatrophihabitans sp. GAS493 TaxID=1907575 RepID=UPI000BB6E361|nr:hypothetical protein [Jatrophihabitans sp. GAS493]SOD74986.1 hypothetical protein SAMN05892883_4183 [Jatrophihabitans sp. GAS493]
MTNTPTGATTTAEEAVAQPGVTELQPRPRPTSTADLWQTVSELAGRIPDDGLLMMRMAIDSGEPMTALTMIAEVVASGHLTITAREQARLSRLARAYRTDPAPYDKAQPVELTPLPYEFDAPDLQDDWADSADDLAILAAAGAGQLQGEDGDEPTLVLPDGPLTVRALWRVTRTSSRTSTDIRLIEVSTGSDRIAATAAAITALADYGVLVPRVEVFGEHDQLTRYQQAAMAGAALVWIAEEPTPPTLAPVFDGAHDGVGYFDPEHTTLTEDDQAAVLHYMRSADTLLAGPGRLDDVITGDPNCVPTDYRTDGQWIWSAASEYYLERHGFAPDLALTNHATSATPAPTSRLQRHIAMETLLNAARAAQPPISEATEDETPS